MNSLSVRRAALVTGLALVLNPVTFAELYAMPHLAGSDAAQTAANMSSHSQLLAMAVLAYFVSALGDIVMAWSIYWLLSPVNRHLAWLGSILQLIYSVVWLSAISNLGVIYRFVAVPDYSAHVDAAQLPLQIQVLLAGFRSGWSLGLVLFGLHLIVTGWLMARSTYLPRWLGWLLMVDGLAWVVDYVGVYLLPKTDLAFTHIAGAAEIILLVWLLGWGWRMKEPEAAR